MKTITLGEICKIEKGKIGIQAAVPGPYPLVTTAEERSSHNEYHFEGEAVCIPLVSATGHGHASIKRLHYQKGKFCVGSILAACLPKDPKKTSAKFLYSYLSLFKDSILVPLMQGSANVSLKIKDLENVLLPNIPFNEQLEIIDLIERVEGKQKLLLLELDQQQSYLQLLRQTILQEAVQGKLTKQSRLLSGANDEPASELLKRIKAEKQKLIKEGKLKKEKELPPITADEIPFELPKGWGWCRLGELFRFIDYRGKTPSRTLDGVRLISAKNIKFGYIDNYPIEYIAESEYDRWMVRGFPQNGDILFVTEGHTMGFVAIINLDFKYVLAQRTICLQPIDYSYSLFLFYSFMSPFVQDSVKKMATGSAAMGVQSAKLKELLIPLPPFPEQQRIVTKVQQLQQQLNALETQVQQSRQYAQQLLQAVLKEAFEINKEYATNEQLTKAAEE